MSWCWLALSPGRPAGADASAALADREGAAAGRLAARIVDPAGAAAWVSLVRPPDGVRLPFDDLAVQGARRVVLSAPPQDAVSTLLSDASHFEGAVTVA